MTLLRPLLSAMLSLLARTAAADDRGSPTAEPERPDISFNATLVPPGAVQVETGLDGGIPPIPSSRSALGMPVTLRIGLHERVELQPLDGDLLPWLTRSDGPDRGLSLAAKIRLNLPSDDSSVPRFVLRPYLQSSLLGAAFEGEAPATGLFVVMTQPLGDKANLDVNAGGHVDPNPDPEERADLRGSASFSFDATSWLHPFVELYVRGDPSKWRDGAFGVSSGFGFRLHPSLVVDVAGRADALARQRAYAVLAGASFGFQGWTPRRRPR